MINVTEPSYFVPFDKNVTEVGGDEQKKEDLILWGKIALSIIIFVLGTIGNLASLFVLTVLKEYKKSVLNLYVLQLAVADLLFLLNIPFKITEDIHREWRFPDWMCTAKETMLFLNYNASVLFLVVMSIDRYIAVCHSFSTFLTRLREPLAAGCIIGLVWLIAILSSIPAMQNAYVVGFKPNCICQFRFPKDVSTYIEELCEDGDEVCISMVKYEYADRPHPTCVDLNDPIYDYYLEDGDYYSDDDDYIPEDDDNIPEDDGRSTTHAQECNYFGSSKRWFSFLRTNFVVLYILPIVIMSIYYGCIAHKVRNVTEPEIPEKAAESLTHNDNLEMRRMSILLGIRNRMTAMAATLACSFVVCWLPFHAVHLAKISGIKLHASKEHICMKLSIFSSIMAYTNSVINPYLYIFLGTDIGKRWRRNRKNETVRNGGERRTSNGAFGL